MRTTSSVESLNSQIGRSFAKHPSIFKFIESLKQHEMTKATRMTKLLMNCPERQFGRKHRIDQERDDKIKYFSSLFEKGSIDVGTFLEAMANKTILPLNGKSLGSLIFNPIKIHLINFSALLDISLTRTRFQHTNGVSKKSRKIKKRAKKTKKRKTKKWHIIPGKILILEKTNSLQWK